ncbi:MAG: hypothetical protein LC130_24525 [Bryobacterales bacterium]|nr:hypothetical protein [Bryobacterales bacterium]
MRKLHLSAMTFAGGLSIASVSMGYELTTHALITDHAYRASTLNPQATNSIVPVLGLDRLADDQPFAFQGEPDSTPYYDDAAVTNPIDNLPPASSSLSVPRTPQNQERTVLDYGPPRLCAGGQRSGDRAAGQSLAHARRGTGRRQRLPDPRRLDGWR